MNRVNPLLLMVPTLDPRLARRCLDSLLVGANGEKIRAIAVYNGDDASVARWCDGDRAVLIGQSQASAIARAIADA